MSLFPKDLFIWSFFNWIWLLQTFVMCIRNYEIVIYDNGLWLFLVIWGFTSTMSVCACILVLLCQHCLPSGMSSNSLRRTVRNDIVEYSTTTCWTMLSILMVRYQIWRKCFRCLHTSPRRCWLQEFKKLINMKLYLSGQQPVCLCMCCVIFDYWL